MLLGVVSVNLMRRAVMRSVRRFLWVVIGTW